MQEVNINIKIPITCGECPFYSEQEYRCHNEIGNEAHCGMGYMKGKDMRDKSFMGSRYIYCRLGRNN